MNPRREGAAGWANKAVSALPRMITETKAINRLKPGLHTWFSGGLKEFMASLFAGSKSTFQVPPKSRRAHARVMAKEMAEIELARKTQLRRHILH
jgi:hypothetical protein